ncbi:MAG: GNAT family N-acetyltransferase [Rhodobacteraceae bacterium]|nr:GNAT family N-acetyltransferase [Paracoccaceae bacterium]
MTTDPKQYTLKLAETEAELLAAQRLRYRVFVEEMGAKTDPASAALRLERDAFDPHFDHLVLLDNSNADPKENVVGVYRLLRGEVAADGPGFYGASEYDLSNITRSGRSVAELGRSCVDLAHRGGVAMHLLWNGLAEYVLSRDIEILFGVASFPGRDIGAISAALSYLHFNHLAPANLRVKVRPGQAQRMDLLAADEFSRVDALRQIPPLIKAYLRLGGYVGEGAYIDRDFNTVDVCLVMDTTRMSERHRAYYVRGQTA